MKNPIAIFRHVQRRVQFARRRAGASKRALPAFLILGAQKAGTTSLYDDLTRHPQIHPALRKEIHYFTLHYDQGPDWYRAHFPILAPPQITGEATPYYLFHPHVPGRVRQLLPNVKLIVMLRNPIDRAWSHYHHSRKLGMEELEFEAAIDAEAQRLAADEKLVAGGASKEAFHHREHSYLARGCYADQLERWFGEFPREQFLIVRSEEYFKAGNETLHRVLAFLGAEQWTPTTQAWGKKGGYSQSMASETRERLRTYFAPENEKLSAMLNERLDWT